MIKSVGRIFFRPSGRSYKLLSYLLNYAKRGYQPRRIDDIKKILERLSNLKKRIDFIQVGSNDGVSGDPINFFVNNYNWHGILVEPIPFLFEQLKNNYAVAQYRLQFLNIAVGKDNEAEQVIYIFDEKHRGKVPDWYYQLGSFYKEVIYHHNIPDVDDYIVEKKVPVRTLESILSANFGGRNIDLLHIDAEGYDFEILKTLDFSKTVPEVILVEYIHLNVESRKKMIGLLKEKGYHVYRCDQDYIALHASVCRLYLNGTKIFPFWE